jgi:spore coat polysaccharide biosynthesis protein SpsF
MLQYLLERVERCTELDGVVVATSTDPSDDPIESFCAERGVDCVRGSLENVAERFCEAAQRQELDAFVRLCADSPLLDPTLIDQAVAEYRSGGADLVSTVSARSFPPGQSVEVISAPVFAEVVPQMSRADHREHVTSYFYDHRKGFKIKAIRSDHDGGDVDFAIDTPRDLERFRALVAAMDRPHWSYGLAELIELQRTLAAAAGPLIGRGPAAVGEGTG